MKIALCVLVLVVGFSVSYFYTKKELEKEAELDEMIEKGLSVKDKENKVTLHATLQTKLVFAASLMAVLPTLIVTKL